MKYTCPVCGNNQLNYAPEDYSICPCCRIEFGVNDRYDTHDELRKAWIAEGAKWGSTYITAPPHWDPVAQLLNIGYRVTDADLIAIGQNGQVDVANMTFPALPKNYESRKPPVKR
jgi:hypothetical protein